jgi:hypothetical protein
MTRHPMRLGVLLLTLACVSCRLAEPADRGEFALIVRDQTTMTDEYVRTPGVLEGIARPRASGAKFGWARYRVEFSVSGDVSRSELSLGRVGTTPDSTPVGTYTITFGPDWIVEEWPNRPPTRVPYIRGTVPVFAPSIAMLQEAVLRARTVADGGEAEVPIYPVLSDAKVEHASLRRVAPDVIAFAWGNARTEYVVRDGKIMRGQSSDGAFVTVRR